MKTATGPGPCARARDTRPAFRTPLVAVAALCVSCAVAVAQPPDAAQLCAPGTVIDRIVIERVNVFDPAVPGENRLAYRFVNLLHRPNQTRERTVRRVLTVRPGDPCSIEVLQEAERDLRGWEFVQDAWVEPILREGNRVTVRVRVRDAWTTRPSASFSSQGGAKSSSFSLYEDNLLGTGTMLGFDHESNQDRTQRMLNVFAPALLPHHVQVRLLTSDNSDGHQRALAVERPFFSLETDRMFRVEYNDQRMVEKVYTGPDPVDLWDLQTYRGAVLYGFAPWGFHDDRLARFTLGVARIRDRWTLDPTDAVLDRPDLAPADRDWVLAHLEWEWRRVDYRRVRYYNRATRVEDLDVGTIVDVKLRPALPGLSPESGGDLNLSIRHGLAVGERDFFRIGGTFTIQDVRGRWFGALATVDAEFWHRFGEYQTIYAHAFLGKGQALEGQDRFLLGGDTGLRGYRSRSFTGENQALFDVEHRFFAPWEVLHVARIGLVGFVEAGGAWDGPFKLNYLHPDIGLGLRVAVLRSSKGTTLHFNLAAPLGQTDRGNRPIRFSVLSSASF